MVNFGHSEPLRSQPEEPGAAGLSGAPRRRRLLCAQGLGLSRGGAGRQLVAQTHQEGCVRFSRAGAQV